VARIASNVTVAQGGVTLLAILATQVIELRLEKRALMRQALPAIASQVVVSKMRACP